jgi:hypothetical protein
MFKPEMMSAWCIASGLTGGEPGPSPIVTNVCRLFGLLGRPKRLSFKLIEIARGRKETEVISVMNDDASGVRMNFYDVSLRHGSACRINPGISFRYDFDK